MSKDDVLKHNGAESADFLRDDKDEDEVYPSKKARSDKSSDPHHVDSDITASALTPQPATIQALLSSLVGTTLNGDSLKNSNVNPFASNLTCRLPLADQSSLIHRLAPTSQGSFPLTDVSKQNLQPTTPISGDQTTNGLLTAICETPGQPPKSVFISKSVAAAFAAAAAGKSSPIGNPILQSSQTTQSAYVLPEEPTSALEQNDIQPTSSISEPVTTLSSDSINFLRCNALSPSVGTPISINLPINTSATLQPTLTVIGSLPNSLANNGPATILSIGSTGSRNITTPNSASAIAALLRGLSRPKPLTPTSVADSSTTRTPTTITSDAPVTTTTMETKPVPDSPQLPLDINSLAAAVAAVTGALPRNPTISPGPLPGSILLSCPKVIPNGDQNAPILNIVNQQTNGSPIQTTTSGTLVTEQNKPEQSSKESPDSTIDRILENIRGQVRASEAEKAARASPVASNSCLRKVKVSDSRPSSLISQSGGIRIQLPIKKSSGKLTPVAPSPTTRTGLSAAVNVSSSDSASNIGPSIESIHKVYKCRYCGKTFNRKFCRERHERLHTGVKPYTCDICDEKFIRLEDKKRHVRSILHTSRVAAAQASGKPIPSGLDPQDMSEGDASPTSEHTFCMDDPATEAQGEAESSEDPIPIPTSPSPPTQATFKHFRRSELKHSVTPVRLLSSEGVESA
ncbi:unnamed protein product [Mesocestoides corti]|nr:unnamed protein product [Mesocestoides corti]